MNSIRFILWDQLSESISSLQDYNPDTDIVLILEFWNYVSYVKHHKKKIVLLFSAMRHFAETLKDKGYRVEYIKFSDVANMEDAKSKIKHMLSTGPFNHIIVTHPGEYHILEDIQNLKNELNISVEMREDNRFLCTFNEFRTWAKDRKQLRMEYFYREMRKKYNILMQNHEKPIGGQWNYDAENRKPPKGGLSIPMPYITKIDDITKEVISLVLECFDDHFGDIYPFYFAVTRHEALKVLNQFIEQRLIHFGDYQDAMIQGEPWMYHSHISFYLNCGLLLPLECVRAAETAYNQGKAPLNAVEGFIRQIIGWREYVRGIYWLKMPDYLNQNFLVAERNLPDFYWTADTRMNCLHQCVLETKRNAYAHHIQRLMVVGNFGLLAGVSPKELHEWFLIVYADAHEWVELPNVLGMILFADGGYLASKPYAAGGSYINKMSNYCKNCNYDVLKKNGSDACPFNYLYWDFLDRNRTKLSRNHRIAMMYKTFDSMSEDRQKAIRDDSTRFLLHLK